MAVKAAFNYRVTSSGINGAGELIPGVEIRVREEIAGKPTPQLYADPDEQEALGNPFTSATGEGHFHCDRPGFFEIEAFMPGGSPAAEPLRYVAIGDAAGFNIEDIIQLIPVDPEGAWDVETTYAQAQLVEHEGHLYLSNVDGNLGHEPPTDPPGSDEWWTWIGACGNKLVGSSATAIDVPTEFPQAVAFDFEQILSLGLTTGQRLRLAEASDPENVWIEGVITAYAHPACTIQADRAKGIGQYAGWSVGLTGEPSDVPGADGTGPGYLMNFETETAAPPTAGGIRFDNADLSAAAKMYVSKVNRENSSIAERLAALYDVARTRKDIAILVDPATEKEASFSITGLTDHPAFVEYDIAQHAGETAFAAGAISLQTDRAGPDGSMSGPATSQIGAPTVFADETGDSVRELDSENDDPFIASIRTIASALFGLPDAIHVDNPDMDALTDTGLYTIVGSPTGRPSGSSGTALALVLNRGLNAGPRVSQFYVNSDGAATQIWARAGSGDPISFSPWERVGNAVLGLLQTWTAAQRSSIIAVSVVAGVATIDLAQGHHFAVAVDANCTVEIANAPAANVSQPGMLEIIMDGTGGYTVTFDDGTSGDAPIVGSDGGAPNAPLDGANAITRYSCLVVANGDVAALPHSKSAP